MRSCFNKGLVSIKKGKKSFAAPKNLLTMLPKTVFFSIYKLQLFFSVCDETIKQISSRSAEQI